VRRRCPCKTCSFASSSPPTYDPCRPVSRSSGTACPAPSITAHSTSHGVPLPFSTYQSREASDRLCGRPGMPTPVHCASDVRPSMTLSSSRDLAPRPKQGRIAALLGFSLQSLTTVGEGRDLSISLPLMRLPSGRTTQDLSWDELGRGPTRVPAHTTVPRTPCCPHGSLQGVAPPDGVVTSEPDVIAPTGRNSLGIHPFQGLSKMAAERASTPLLPRAFPPGSTRVRLEVSTYHPVDRSIRSPLIRFSHLSAPLAYSLGPRRNPRGAA
jgi:hypothetical protein